MCVYLRTFEMEIDKMGIWMQTISLRNGWNGYLDQNLFWMEISGNECLDENQFEWFIFYTIRENKISTNMIHYLKIYIYIYIL